MNKADLPVAFDTKTEVSHGRIISMNRNVTPIRPVSLVANKIGEAKLPHSKARVVDGKVENIYLFGRDAEGTCLLLWDIEKLGELLEEWGDLYDWARAEMVRTAPDSDGTPKGKVA